MHCTQCGAEGTGRFCAACGAPLKALSCRRCGAQVPSGTRFCTSCGTPAGGRGSPGPAATGGGSGDRRGADAGWWVAGGLLLVIILWVGVSLVADGGSSAPLPVPTSASGTTDAPAGTPPDLSTMTPREAADRLFNRVMEAAAREDTEEANTFLPMAIQAYELAWPLNADGLFHLSLLQRAAGEPEASLMTALQGLESNPEHLLNLSSAAEAALQLGDAAAGEEYYRRMLDAWDRETAAARQEYEEHAPLLPLIREDAEALLPGG